MASRDRVPRDCELLIPVADSGDKDALSKPSSSSSSSHHTGHEYVLFPIAITFYIAWWYIHFVNSFFFPIHAQLGINIFGPGFVNMHSGSSLHPLSLRIILKSYSGDEELCLCSHEPSLHW
ncbi:protein CONTINUOUS VASCULAR RING 1-like [Malus sylvestris]|uniref:protein CONTINUOUS VASCULAR RING 1-like n=1 Tax=Malus sylvestris TaxID=3752 RepID=UPI0021AC0D0B|nr:protein CONTINUOUS VASCULAR RING 1-like [Malus sylvestris]